MRAEPPLVLDISRLVSRIGTGPLTGIDRVEAAWLRHIAERPHLLLCRVARGQALLPPEAGHAVLRWLEGDNSGMVAQSGWRERMAGHRGPRGRAATALRRMALCVTGSGGRGLLHRIEQQLPGAAYLNLGHSNLRPALLRNLKGLRRAVMIHDTIPLSHPEFTREDQSAAFRDKFMAAITLADLVIAISDATRSEIELWHRRLAITRSPEIITAHIGTALALPDAAQIPAQLDLSRPFFVTIGTIEPRKNHALLLDAWEILDARLPGPDMPQLVVIGRRGWRNEAVFARLDTLPPDSPVLECPGLSDASVAALLARCHALLMPSHAEGFGLPLTEAAGRGVAVLTSPLPVARELLGDHAQLLPPDRPEAWAEAVEALAASPPQRHAPHPVPSWQAHFSTVEGALGFPKP